MRLRQVSVFVENRPGRIKEMLVALAEEEINIRALAIADTADFGIVRMILSDTDKGLAAVRRAGLTASTTEVVSADIPDQPGGLLKAVAEPLSNAGVNIEYIYAFVDSPLEKARVVLKVSDPERAERALGQ